VILLFHPKDIGGGTRTIGKNLHKIYRPDSYRAIQQASDGIRGLPSRSAKEAELEDLKQINQKLQDAPSPPKKTRLTGRHVPKEILSSGNPSPPLGGPRHPEISPMASIGSFLRVPMTRRAG
jgi:hypothetical protein